VQAVEELEQRELAQLRGPVESADRGGARRVSPGPGRHSSAAPRLEVGFGPGGLLRLLDAQGLRAVAGVDPSALRAASPSEPRPR